MCLAHTKCAPRAYLSKVLCPQKQSIVLPLVLFLDTNSVGCVESVRLVPVHGQ